MQEETLERDSIERQTPTNHVSINATPDGFTFEADARFSIVGELLQRAELLTTDPSGARTVALVFRELLNNAIQHGAHSQSQQRVQGGIRRLTSQRFGIWVQDDGDGFDYRALDMSLPEDPRQVRKRGLVLVRALCEEVTFNEKGNRITVVIPSQRE